MNNYTRQQIIIEWLQDYNAFKASIENLEETINDIAEAGMGINYDKDPSGPTNQFSSTTENAVLKMDKEKITHKIKVMANIVNKLDRALQSLDDIEREVITNRCIKGQYYYQFCGKISVSERTAKRIKEKALRKMNIVIFGKE